MTPAELDARAAIVDRLCEFLVVATHAVLYIHRVYPCRIFEMRERYGVATLYSKHPQVNDYITRTVTAFQPFLIQDLVESVTIAIINVETKGTIARYTFDIKLSHPSLITAATLSSLDVQLRAHICRLLATSADIPDVAGDRNDEASESETTFDYVLKTRGVRTDHTWMAADGSERHEICDAIAIPIKDGDRLAPVQLTSRVELQS